MLWTGQWTAFFGVLVNELFMSFKNTGFNIVSYYVEGENLSRIVRQLRVDFIIADDVQNLNVSFFPQCLIMVL